MTPDLSQSCLSPAAVLIWALILSLYGACAPVATYEPSHGGSGWPRRRRQRRRQFQSYLSTMPC